MKSIVLILWLTLPTGKEQFLLTRHMDDQAACAQAAQALVVEHGQRGEKVRFQCHEVVEEVGGVDENGNPLPANVMHVDMRRLTP